MNEPLLREQQVTTPARVAHSQFLRRRSERKATWSSRARAIRYTPIDIFDRMLVEIREPEIMHTLQILSGIDHSQAVQMETLGGRSCLGPNVR